MCPSGRVLWWTHERSFQCNGQGRSQMMACCRVSGKSEKVEIAQISPSSHLAQKRRKGMAPRGATQVHETKQITFNMVKDLNRLLVLGERANGQ